jgi:hypothetical protein
VEIGDGGLRAPYLADCRAGSTVAVRLTLPMWGRRMFLAAGFLVALWALLAVAAGPARADESVPTDQAGCGAAVVEDVLAVPPVAVQVTAETDPPVGPSNCAGPEQLPAPGDPVAGPPVDPDREQPSPPPENSPPDPAPKPLPEPAPVPLPLPDPAPQPPVDPQPAPQPAPQATPQPEAPPPSEPVAAAEEPAAAEPAPEATEPEPQAAEPVGAEPAESVSTVPVTAVAPATSVPVLPGLCASTPVPVAVPPSAEFASAGRARDHPTAGGHTPTGDTAAVQAAVAPPSVPVDTPVPLAPHGMPVPMPAPAPSGSSTSVASGSHGFGPGHDLLLDATNAALAAEIADPLVGLSAAMSAGFARAVVGGADDPGASPG